jgi:hypothetical protein
MLMSAEEQADCANVNTTNTWETLDAQPQELSKDTFTDVTRKVVARCLRGSGTSKKTKQQQQQQKNQLHIKETLGYTSQLWKHEGWHV